MKRALAILDVVLAAGCAYGLVRVIAVIGTHAPLDPNEGWNAYHTVAAMMGGPLYPDARSFMFNNYPPLSFYFVGLFGGDYIVAGRIVSLVSLLAVSAGIYASARRMGAERAAGVFGALWFLAGLLAFTDYAAMDDPQLLGHAVAMGGFLLLLRGNAIAAAAAMTLALFVKHNLIVMPLAALIWLAVFERRNALKFAGASVAFGLAGLLLSGLGLLGHLNSPRAFSFALLADNIAHWMLWGGPGLLVMAALVALRRDDNRVALIAIYALTATLAGTVFAGGAGVDMNIWFDAAIALSLAASLALNRLHAVLALAYVMPLVLGLALVDHELPAPADDDIAFLKTRHGPASCEMLSLCYWSGKQAEVDVFNLGQAYAIHARDEAPLIARIEAHYYSAMEFDSMDEFALGPRVKQAVLDNYRIDHEDDNGTFLVPR
jgi:hypothetical protein